MVDQLSTRRCSWNRKNQYFQKALSVGNGSNPVWQQVDIVATLGGSSTSSTGFVYTAKTPVVYTHDDDGNLVKGSVLLIDNSGFQTVSERWFEVAWHGFI